MKKPPSDFNLYCFVARAIYSGASTHNLIRLVLDLRRTLTPFGPVSSYCSPAESERCPAIQPGKQPRIVFHRSSRFAWLPSQTADGPRLRSAYVSTVQSLKPAIPWVV